MIQPSRARRHLSLGFLFGILLLSLAVNVVVLLMLNSHNLRYRFVRTDNWQVIAGSTDVSVLPAFAKIADEQRFAEVADPRRRCDAVVKWLRNFVTRASDDGNLGPESLLRHARSGGGTLCAGMTVLGRNLMCAAGVETRTVWLFRDLFGRDSHSVIEARIGSRWGMIDPSLGFEFETEGANWRPSRRFEEASLSRARANSSR